MLGLCRWKFSLLLHHIEEKFILNTVLIVKILFSFILIIFHVLQCFPYPIIQGCFDFAKWTIVHCVRILHVLHRHHLIGMFMMIRARTVMRILHTYRTEQCWTWLASVYKFIRWFSWSKLLLSNLPNDFGGCLEIRWIVKASLLLLESACNGLLSMSIWKSILVHTVVIHWKPSLIILH